MKQKQLLQYLRTVLELEKQKRTTANAIQTIDERIKSLGNKKNIKEVKKPSYCLEDANPIELLGFIFSIPIGVALIWFVREAPSLIRIVGTGVGVMLFIPLVLTFFLPLIDYLKELYNFPRKRDEYRRQIALEDARVSREQSLAKEMRADRAVLYTQWKQITATLNQHYSLNIVYPSYRSLVPIAMFVQYLESGRCTQLTGHEGCYNLYEQEKLQGIIIAKLDIVIQKLDEIQAAQYELQRTIRESNRDIQKLCNRQLDAQQQHARIAEYQRQQMLDQQRILGEYVIFRDLLRQ